MDCIPNKTDFTLTIKLKDKDGVTIDPNILTSWEFKFYTTPYVFYEISKKSNILKNCTIDRGLIKGYVDNFDFNKRGDLQGDLTFSLPSPDFPDGNQRVTLESQSFLIKII